MAHDYSATLSQLIRQQMATGRYGSEEQLLIEALESLEDSAEELRAIEDALTSLEQGDAGVSVEEAFGRLRKKHDIRD